MTNTERNKHPTVNIEHIHRKKARTTSRPWILLIIAAICLFSAGNKLLRLYVLSDVPNELFELYKRNPDARQFVIDYKNEHDKYHAIDLSNCAYGGTVPLLMQWDERWGYGEYAGNYFALSGCGPTCLSMAYIYLTGDTEKSPAYIAEFSEKNGYSSQGNGSCWSLISEGGEKLGLDVTEIPLDKQRIDDNLNVGNPIICVMGPGAFTTSGHFVVLTSISNGKYSINDPNSYKNSEKLWDYSEFSDQINSLWVLRR